jgi:2'-5' RNA ligase
MAPGRGSVEVYSLWLLPAGAGRRRLAALIARLARRCGTEPFDPHVTLLGGIALPRGRAIGMMTALAGGLRAFPVRLLEARHEAAFFRCLSLRADGPGLRKARAAAVRALDEAAERRPGMVRRNARRTAGRFRPHLSLVYGLLPAADRRRLAQEIGRRFALTFMARRIALVRTGGDPRTWRAIAVQRLARA